MTKYKFSVLWSFLYVVLGSYHISEYTHTDANSMYSIIINSDKVNLSRYVNVTIDCRIPINVPS